MKKYLIIFLTVSLVATVKAQREINMFFLENVMQSTYVNPVAIPEHKVSVGWSAYGEFLAPTFTLNDLHNGTDWLVTDLLNDHLKDKNLIGASIYTDLLSFRFKAGNNYISFTNQLKVDQGFTYPGDLFRFGWKGNGGDQESFDFSGLGMKTQIYSEHGIGLTFEEKKWVWGGKFKIYNGIGTIKMNMEKFNLNFSNAETDNYTATADAQFLIQIAGLQGAIDVDSLEEGSLYFEDGTEVEETIGDKYVEQKPVLRNFGMGIDFGAQYKYSEKLEFYATLTDLGYIRWKNDVYEYEAKYKFEFDGLEFDLTKALDDEDGEYLDSIAEAIPDSAQDAFEYSPAKAASYVTSPITRFYVGGRYKIFPRTHVNAMFSFVFSQGVRAGFTIAVYQEVQRWLNISITNTYQNGVPINLGLGLVIKPGPFQIFFAMDNIPVFYQQDVNNPDIPIPSRMNQFNARAGLNFVFGRNKVQEKLQGIVE